MTEPIHDAVRERSANAAMAVLAGPGAACCADDCCADGCCCDGCCDPLRAAGLTDIPVTPTHPVADGMHSAIIRASNPG